MRIKFNKSYERITSLDNLLAAWQEFTRGKKKRKDVQIFAFNLMDNLLSLHDDLVSFRYRHGGYHAFTISDPKPRNIHKASVRDRVLHHALYCQLYPFFERTFIDTSFSCRDNKGTHKALDCFNAYARIVGRNHTRTCWVLKMDIRKFFASIDQVILLKILSGYIPDERIIWLLEQVILSFHSTRYEVGLPLGNLTSQLLVNIYMNEFDQFAKHKLKAKYYIRYADDFVILSENRAWLEQQIIFVNIFLSERLHLTLHPDKVSIQTFACGVDFLGWVNFPNHCVLRTATKRRMCKRIQEHPSPETLQSYLGLLSHGKTFNLRGEVLDLFGLNVY